MAENILTLSNIRKSFGDLEVLKDISISVDKGEVVSIIGSSGSGKSTILRCATFLETIDAGEIRYLGDKAAWTENGKAVYAKNLKPFKSYFGLVFQNFNLFPHWNILRNITEAPVSVHGVPQKEAEGQAMELLKKLGLESKADAYPYQLSGGQQQRAAIARALILHPKVLFFDEPTSALDPELTGEVLRVIRQLAKEHTTMVIVTHEMLFARDVSDRIVFMDEGVVIENCTPAELFASTNPRTQSFLGKYLNPDA